MKSYEAPVSKGNEHHNFQQEDFQIVEILGRDLGTEGGRLTGREA